MKSEALLLLLNLLDRLDADLVAVAEGRRRHLRTRPGRFAPEPGHIGDQRPEVAVAAFQGDALAAGADDAERDAGTVRGGGAGLQAVEPEPGPGHRPRLIGRTGT